MNNEKINSKIKLSNIFRSFKIHNVEIPKYWSFYIRRSKFRPPPKNWQISKLFVHSKFPTTRNFADSHISPPT